MATTTRTSSASVLSAGAARVAAIADANAEFGDKEGRLADSVVEALHREELFGMWTPRSIRGGAELDPVTSLRLIETVSSGIPLRAGCC